MKQRILAKYKKVSGLSSLESKLHYLEYVQKWEFYGCTVWIVEQTQFVNHPSALMLGINCEGIILMHPENKTILERFKYTDIVTFRYKIYYLSVLSTNKVN